MCVVYLRRRILPTALRLLAFAILATPALFGLALLGEEVLLDKEAYLKPPKEIEDVLRAAWYQNVTLTNLSPGGKKFLITKSDGAPTLERLARPCVHLGEMAFDPVAQRAHQLYVRSSAGFEIFYPADKRTVAVEVPAKARVSNPAWSPDGSQLAFFAHFPEVTHVFVADGVTGKSRQLTQAPVLATLVTSFRWSADGASIQTVLVPSGTQPLRPGAVAGEPKIRMTLAEKAPSRTYRFLLESPFDQKLFEQLITGQLALIRVADGRVSKIGAPTMIRSVSMSPSGREFRVTRVKKPFSYYVPADRFGSVEGIWDAEGKMICMLAEKSLRETDPQTPAVAKASADKAGQVGKNAKGTVPSPAGKVPAPKTDSAGAADGKRDLGWRPDGRGLTFLHADSPKTPEEKKPADDKKADAKTPDNKKPDEKKVDSKKPSGGRVMQWLAPFGKDNVKVVYETSDPINSVLYSEDCQWLFLTQTIDKQTQIVGLNLNDPKSTYVIYKSSKTPVAAAKSDKEDSLQAPLAEMDEAGRDEQAKPKKGSKKANPPETLPPSLMTRSGRGDTRVVRISSLGEVYLAGTDKAAEGSFPKAYIDKINIRSGETKRIFSGRTDVLETIDGVDGDDLKVVYTMRQKENVIPDCYLNDVNSGKEEKLTHNIDRAPWYRQLQVQRFQVTRVDGFKFWVKVTAPPNQSGRMPAMFWIYPREYADQAAYDKANSNKDSANMGRFAPAPAGSMTPLTRVGYLVVEPDVPIVGPAGRINDNYVPDLRNSLWAVVDELDRRGLIDRDKLAIGGHSYGAFGTANALIHTPFFKAGIAGDGNYNRTLTPMSFQSEKRHLWEARETYLEMSPLLWADRMNGALLMYHGMDDDNVGTHPIHAEHLFRALRGLGKPAALYMYPYEGHGPIALETTLDQWARWTAWLDRYVRNPQPAKGTLAGAATKYVPLPEALKHVPEDALGFVHVRIAAWLESAPGKQLLEQIRNDKDAARFLQDLEKKTGVTLAGVESVTVIFPTALPPVRSEPASIYQPLLLVTTTQAINRNAFLQASLFRQGRSYKEPPFPLLGLGADASLVFLSDRSVLVGAASQLLRYVDAVTNPTANAKSAAPRRLPGLAPAEVGNHFIVAGGHVSPGQRNNLLSQFGSERMRSQLAPLYPLLSLASARLTVDAQTSVDMRLQLEATSDQSAALAAQSVRAALTFLDVMLKSAQDGTLHERKGERKGERFDVAVFLREALAKVSIEQTGKSVHCRLQIDIPPDFFQRLIVHAGR